MLVENHWLISNFHRDLNYRENKPHIRMREILQRHTYRIEGATRQWATESNRQLMKDKNVTKHAEGSQAPNTTPHSASTTKPSLHRPVSPRDTPYRGKLRGDMASEKYELRPRANQGPEASRFGYRSSSSSLSYLGSDDDEEAEVLEAPKADVPDQGNVGEVMPEEDMPDENMPDEDMPDEVISDEITYIRTVVRQLEDMPAAVDFEEKTIGDIKTEPGLDPWR